MPSLYVRFQDVTNKIASVVQLYENDDIMERIRLGKYGNIETLKTEIIRKIERIALENNTSEFS